ncbi:hypothetical protein D3C83_00210 [compost metagenome]
MPVAEFTRHFTYVPALISIARKSDRGAAQLEVAQPGRQHKDVHLPAGVVDVVLAGDVKARRGEHIGKARSISRAASMADMQRPGGIGRYELDLHPLVPAERESAVSCARLQDTVDHQLLVRVLQEQVDEPRSRDFGLFQARRLREGRDQLRGYVARLGAQ